MFTATAEYYDALYSFKNYGEEADAIRRILAREHPGAKSILDVACGTGAHAQLLAASFQMDGIDAEPKFIQIAQAKHPGGTFTVADMRSFQLGRRYDVVQCLFSSIGYLLTAEDIVAALTCFRQHLAPGGVILVEPWLAPSVYKPGLLNMLTVDQPDLKICRICTPELQGGISVLNFQYLIATGESVMHAEEVHRLALIPTEQMQSYFQQAGLDCAFDPTGPSGRGLFIARPHMR